MTVKLLLSCLYALLDLQKTAFCPTDVDWCWLTYTIHPEGANDSFPDKIAVAMMPRVAMILSMTNQCCVVMARSPAIPDILSKAGVKYWAHQPIT